MFLNLPASTFFPGCGVRGRERLRTGRREGSQEAAGGGHVVLVWGAACSHGGSDFSRSNSHQQSKHPFDYQTIRRVSRLLDVKEKLINTAGTQTNKPNVRPHFKSNRFPPMERRQNSENHKSNLSSEFPL